MGPEIKELLDIVHEAKELSKFLECDGSTRVLNYLLNKKGIPHKVFIGEVYYQNKKIPLHYWIMVGKYILDNKIKIYLGDSVPEGVFSKSPAKYVGSEVEMDTSDTIFQILTYNPPGFEELINRDIKNNK